MNVRSIASFLRFTEMAGVNIPFYVVLSFRIKWCRKLETCPPWELTRATPCVWVLERRYCSPILFAEPRLSGMTSLGPATRTYQKNSLCGYRSPEGGFGVR